MVVLYSTNLPHPILPGKIYTSTLMLFLYRHTEIRSNKEKNEKFFIWFWSFLSFQNHSKTLFPIDVVCMHLYAYIYTFIWRIWLGRRFILHHECCSGLLKVGNLICYFDWPMIWCGGWKIQNISCEREKEQQQPQQQRRQRTKHSTINVVHDTPILVCVFDVHVLGCPMYDWSALRYYFTVFFITTYVYFWGRHSQITS